MAETQLEQSAWVRPRDDDFLMGKSEEALELLSAVQRGLEDFGSVRANPDRGSKPLTDSPTRLVALDTPQLREALGRIGRNLSAKPHDAGDEFYGRLSVCQGRAPFFRGFLDRYVDVPLVTTRNPGVIYFLQAIPKIDDKLKRENHAQFGIHYHYLNGGEERSNTILCFKHEMNWPLFSEKHAEKSSQFDARPGAW